MSFVEKIPFSVNAHYKLFDALNNAAALLGIKLDRGRDEFLHRVLGISLGRLVKANVPSLLSEINQRERDSTINRNLAGYNRLAIEYREERKNLADKANIRLLNLYGRLENIRAAVGIGNQSSDFQLFSHPPDTQVLMVLGAGKFASWGYPSVTAPPECPITLNYTGQYIKYEMDKPGGLVVVLGQTRYQDKNAPHILEAALTPLATIDSGNQVRIITPADDSRIEVRQISHCYKVMIDPDKANQSFGRFGFPYMVFQR